MAIDNRHPDYADRVDEWEMMRDARRGPHAINKKAERKYLPIPSGFTGQSDGGKAYYDIYRGRARYPELVKDTLLGMVGVIHRVEAEITMPDDMNGLIENATPEGLTLEALHRKITEEVLLQGRYGLLVDAPPEGADLPYIAPYEAEDIINWSKKRDMFVLDESDWQLVEDGDGYTWHIIKKYRALKLVDGNYLVTIDEQGKQIEENIEPNARGGAKLEKIPFTIIGPLNLLVDPDEPPLIGIARAALAMYQLSADYRWQLYMSGQETLFCYGVDKKDLPTVLGAGVVVGMPDGDGVRAEFVGPSGAGIAAHRTAIEDEANTAVSVGARVVDSSKGGVESGEALRLRQSATTASLTTVALNSASGLEDALRNVARFMGKSEAEVEKITVKANLEFVDTEMNPADAEALVRMWQGNAISWLTLQENLRRGRIASEERTADEEKRLIDEDPQGDISLGEPGEDNPEDITGSGAQPGEGEE
jgi:hypothetical protein